jgi:DNA polymerase-3 subunit chi
VLAVADGREVAAEDYKKILHIFDGNNEADLKTARERWKTYKSAGHNLHYWFQDGKGKWAEKNL